MREDFATCIKTSTGKVLLALLLVVAAALGFVAREVVGMKGSLVASSSAVAAQQRALEAKDEQVSALRVQIGVFRQIANTHAETAQALNQRVVALGGRSIDGPSESVAK